MKAFRSILPLLCTLLGLFCACGHKPYPHPLIVADSLTNACPDSAIALLGTLKERMTNEDEATQMYYRLLCIKANDKAYIPHTSDSLILPVLHYYIDKDDKRHLPEAYYYAGRVYRDLKDAPQALDYFQKAIAASPSNGQYELKSKIYSQTGTLFAYQGMYAEAIKMYREGGKCDEMLKDSVGMIYTLRDIGNMYQGLGQLDSTLFYLKKANRLSVQIRHIGMFNMMQSQLASIYTDLQMYDSARIPLQNALRKAERPGKSAIYSIAASFYDATGQMDSVVWYYNELLKFGTIYAKKTAYRRLLELAIAQNDTKLVPHYLREHLRYVDSIRKLTQTETIHRMHSLYNYQLREKENLRLKAENQHKNFWIAIISSSLLFAIALFTAYRQYSKRKNLMLQLQLEKLRKIEKENREKIAFLEKYHSQKEELNKG
ncbi:MAG: tetratricopeptide repeat protein, partial [Bacteroides sp.]|nr:tetratricopeptide repeat protein [Bacteroides sp.]